MSPTKTLVVQGIATGSLFIWDHSTYNLKIIKHSINSFKNQLTLIIKTYPYGKEHLMDLKELMFKSSVTVSLLSRG